MRKRKNKKGLLIGGITAGVVVILAGGGVFAWKLLINTTTPKEKLKGSPVTVKYSETMETSADEISFDNAVTLQKEDGEYKIDWDSTVIFPNLQDSYKVQIQTESAQRGTIYDRNGVILAGNGTVLEVGLVPGKMGYCQGRIYKEAGRAIGCIGRSNPKRTGGILCTG